VSLEQREVRRLGGGALIPLDLRLVVATHQDIEGLVTSGKMREDLYYRLNVIPIRVPPLRERRDDVPLLTQHFLRWAQQRHGREPKQVASAAMRALCEYSWPGNVRQLKNLMERLVVTVEGPTIHLEDLPKEMHPPRAQPVVDSWPGNILEPQNPELSTLDAAVAEVEKATILAALDRCNHHRERTAQLLGIQRPDAALQDEPAQPPVGHARPAPTLPARVCHPARACRVLRPPGCGGLRVLAEDSRGPRDRAPFRARCVRRK